MERAGLTAVCMLITHAWFTMDGGLCAARALDVRGGLR